MICAAHEALPVPWKDIAFSVQGPAVLDPATSSTPTKKKGCGVSPACRVLRYGKTFSPSARAAARCLLSKLKKSVQPSSSAAATWSKPSVRVPSVDVCFAERLLTRCRDVCASKTQPGSKVLLELMNRDSAHNSGSI